MIADVDKDGSGAIDFDEFVHMMTAKIGERDSKEELTKAFQIIDQDKNVRFYFLLLVFPPLLGPNFLYFKLREKYLSRTLSALQRIWVRNSLKKRYMT